MDIISRIQSQVGNRSKGHEAVAQYIIGHREQAAFMTARTLGEAVGVSESTVVRFATGLGYSGYPDMREALHSLILTRLPSRRGSDGDAESALRRAVGLEAEHLRQTAGMLDYPAAEELVGVLAAARRVFTLGLRGGAALSVFAYQTMLAAGGGRRDIRFVSGGELPDGLLHAGEGDCLFCFSFPPYAPETVRAVRYARRRGAAAAAVMDGRQPGLAASVRYILHVPCEVGGRPSMTTPLSVVGALLAALSEQWDGTPACLERDWYDG